jgi:hypothetical protein
MSPSRSERCAGRTRWEALNAYVDGELDHAEAAEVAALISRDPGLARQAAALTRMTAAAGTAYEADGFVPDLRDPGPSGRARRYRVAAFAAAALLAVALATALIGTGRGDPAWLTAAVARHGAMSAQKPTMMPRLSTIAATAGFGPYLPDLTSARLSLAAAEPFSAEGVEDGLILHFRGTRGCKLSYVAFVPTGETALLRESLVEIANGGARGYGWRVGDIGYLLIARGMDEARLGTMARTIQAASRKFRPLDDAEIMELAESRANSSSCPA